MTGAAETSEEVASSGIDEFSSPLRVASDFVGLDGGSVGTDLGCDFAWPAAAACLLATRFEWAARRSAVDWVESFAGPRGLVDDGAGFGGSVAGFEDSRVVLLAGMVLAGAKAFATGAVDGRCCDFDSEAGTAFLGKFGAMAAGRALDGCSVVGLAVVVPAFSGEAFVDGAEGTAAARGLGGALIGLEALVDLDDESLAGLCVDFPGTVDVKEELGTISCGTLVSAFKRRPSP